MNKKANPIGWIFFILGIIVVVGLLLMGISVVLYLLNTLQPYLPEKPIENNTQFVIDETKLYPQNKLATGSLMNTNLTQICVKGYSTSVRDVSLATKKEVYRRDKYAYPQPTQSVELDHIYPLCMGGSNEKDNLFVQEAPYYKWKDRVEVNVCVKMCAGTITQEEARATIDNWYDYYQTLIS